MKPHAILESCEDDDVIELGSGVVKMKELKTAITTCFQTPAAVMNGYDYPSNGLYNSVLKSGFPIRDIPNSGWFGTGVNCKVLQVNRGWVKGRIKISVNVEFYPDEGSAG